MKTEDWGLIEDWSSMLAENQTGGSSQALCAVCRRSLPLTRLRLIRVHGPVGDRCPDSRNPPIQAPDLMSPVSTLNPSRPTQRPQRLKDMIGYAAGEGGHLLLKALTEFINFTLEGKVAPFARHFFFGASLTALTKTYGGVRPIAVGCTLRRLAAKCASNSVKQAMVALLVPHQLGYSTPLGAEAAVHASRIYLRNMQEHHLLLKLDFKNAFNCLRRDKMLAAVSEKAPKLLPFIHSAYGTPSSLFIGDTIIQSAEGIQQGDPLGPLLFCLTTMEIMEQLRSELIIF